MSITLWFLIIVIFAGFVAFLASKKDWKLLGFLKNSPNSSTKESTTYNQDPTSENRATFLLRLANEYSRSGLWGEAVRAISGMFDQNAIPKDMSREDLKLKLAEAYFNLGELKKAHPILLELFNKGHDQKELLLLLSKSYLLQNKPDYAKIFAEKLQSQDLNATVGDNYKSVLALANNDLDQAVSFLQSDSSTNKYIDPYLQYKLALIQMTSADYAKAFETLDKIPSNKIPEKLQPKIHLAFGFASLRIGKIEKALQHFLAYLTTGGEESNWQMDYDILAYYLILSNHPHLAFNTTNLPPGIILEDDELRRVSNIGNKSVNSSSSFDDAITAIAESFRPFVVLMSEIGLPNVKSLPNEESLANAEETLRTSIKKMGEAYSLGRGLVLSWSTLDDELFRQSVEKMLLKLNLGVLKLNHRKGVLEKHAGDGFDIIAYPLSDESQKGSTLVRVRRWKDVAIGDLTLRHLRDEMESYAFNSAIFIGNVELTDEASLYLHQNKEIKVIGNKELEFLLQGIVDPSQNKAA